MAFLFRSKHYAIFLEVHCPCVKPSVVVISDKGKSLVDFGCVATGLYPSSKNCEPRVVTKYIVIQPHRLIIDI